MSFAGGAVSFQRFLISGRVPEELTDHLLESFASRAFGRLRAQTDDTQFGWIGPRHLFDTELAASPISVGSYLHLALRIDALRAPANVVRAYVRVEEEATLAASGRNFLSKAERKQARGVALARAEQEAKGGAFRRMSAYPVLIDLAQRVVYLAQLGAGAADRLMALLGDTLGCAIEPVDPERLANRIAARARRERDLEGLTPFTLVRAPDGTGGGVGYTPDLSFLGKEFLTWLWFQIDTDAGAARLVSGDDVTVMIDRVLRLKCDFGLTGTDMIAADGPANLPEARAALASGKQPVKAGLVLGAARGEFRFTLDGPKFAISGLALPEDDVEQDAVAHFEQRCERIADAAVLLDALYELFILRRTARDWPDELREMASWASGAKLRRRQAVSA